MKSTHTYFLSLALSYEHEEDNFIACNMSMSNIGYVNWFQCSKVTLDVSSFSFSLSPGYTFVKVKVEERDTHIQKDQNEISTNLQTREHP